MSLDLTKLEKVAELADGAKRARCPACAEGGGDTKGEHLRIYPDGKFGCCVHPGDREHRQRIFALAGSRQRQGIAVRVAGPKPPPVLQSGVLGRLGRVFGSPARPAEPADTDVGTLGTPQYSHAYEEKNLLKGEVCNRELIEFQTPVPSVPELAVPPESQRPVPSVPKSEEAADEPPKSGDKLPFLTADGTLSIPFDCPERYHWWKGGQSVAATLAEVRAGLPNQERSNHAAEF